MMNKGDLVEAVAKVVGKKMAEDTVNCISDTIKSSLKKDEKVSHIGFGTFFVVKRAARTGINPETGKAITIKAKKVIRFRAWKGLMGRSPQTGKAATIKTKKVIRFAVGSSHPDTVAQ